MDIADEMAEHEFFAPMGPEQRALIAGCGRNVAFEAGTMIVSEGEPADAFYLIRRGAIGFEAHDPARGTVPLQTLHAGDVLGWSWIFPPYRWTADARAVEAVGAVAFDGECLRRKCDDDPRLGYDLMKRFAAIMARRFAHTRLQLLDVYAKGSDGPGL